MRDFPLAKMYPFFVACTDTGKGREHACTDASGRETQDA